MDVNFGQPRARPGEGPEVRGEGDALNMAK